VRVFFVQAVIKKIKTYVAMDDFQPAVIEKVSP
jgi:hypothetical protein